MSPIDARPIPVKVPLSPIQEAELKLFEENIRQLEAGSLDSDDFMRNPLNQNLPRKFKFAFEGCPTDHARVPIHDFGAVAKFREVNGKKVRGFATYVGGGLGATPHAAELIEDFTPAELLIPTA